jgi:hypothetical protein
MSGGSSGRWHATSTAAGSGNEAATAARTGLLAAERLGDTRGIAVSHGCLAYAYAHLRRYDEAEHHMRQALDMHTELGDRNAMALLAPVVRDGPRPTAALRGRSRALLRGAAVVRGDGTRNRRGAVTERRWGGSASISATTSRRSSTACGPSKFRTSLRRQIRRGRHAGQPSAGPITRSAASRRRPDHYRQAIDRFRETGRSLQRSTLPGGSRPGPARRGRPRIPP